MHMKHIHIYIDPAKLGTQENPLSEDEDILREEESKVIT